jgi:hypothetical protein
MVSASGGQSSPARADAEYLYEQHSRYPRLRKTRSASDVTAARQVLFGYTTGYHDSDSANADRVRQSLMRAR